MVQQIDWNLFVFRILPYEDIPWMGITVYKTIDKNHVGIEVTEFLA